MDKYCTLQSTTEKISITKPDRIIVCINAFPSNPEALRGYQGDVTLDEYGYHVDPWEMYRAAEPATMRAGRLRIISTHNGPNTAFNHILIKARLGENDFSVHKCDIYQAVNQGLAHQIVSDAIDHPLRKLLHDRRKLDKAFVDYIRKSCGSTLTWSQEYECQVHASEMQLVTPELYRGCILTDDEYPEIPPDTTNPLYVGIDVGYQALTVVWTIEQVWDPQDEEYVYITKSICPMRHTSIPDQLHRIRQILAASKNVQAIAVDMGAQGRGISDALRDEFGSTAIPVSINQPKKAELCELVRTMVERKRISLPHNDLIEQDFCSMSLEYSRTGAVKYSGGTGSGETYSHADYFMAAGLALLAAESCPSVALV